MRRAGLVFVASIGIAGAMCLPIPGAAQIQQPSPLPGGTPPLQGTPPLPERPPLPPPP